MFWSENICHLQSCLCYHFASCLSNSSRLWFFGLFLQHHCYSRLGLSYGSVDAASLKQKPQLEGCPTALVWLLGTVGDWSSVIIPPLSWRRQIGPVMRWIHLCGSEGKAIKVISEHAMWHRTDLGSLARVSTSTRAVLHPFVASFCRMDQNSPVLIYCFCMFCAEWRNATFLWKRECSGFL